MAIVKVDPFREFAAMQDRMNRLFGNVYLRDEDTGLRGSWVPPVDIYETENHDLVVRAELPGLKITPSAGAGCSRDTGFHSRNSSGREPETGTGRPTGRLPCGRNGIRKTKKFHAPSCPPVRGVSPRRSPWPPVCSAWSA